MRVRARNSSNKIRTHAWVLVSAALFSAGNMAGAASQTSAETGEILRHARDSGIEQISPILRIERPGQVPHAPRLPGTDEPASMDGSGHNLSQPDMNATHTRLRRYMPADYADQVSAMAGAGMPNPRTISNIVNSQGETKPNPANASDFLWQWGQFVDHDIDLTDGANPPDFTNIAIPPGDSYFDPNWTGAVTLSFNRSLFDTSSGTASDNPRQQLNEITGWIDASNVYGSDPQRAAALRSNDGTGQLRTSAGNLLPYNTAGLSNAGGNSERLFLAGDVRVNEQVALTAMHTLFVREHNLQARHVAAKHPQLTDEQIYQRARRIVMAEMQSVTYNEFLPVLLGKKALARYRGYNPAVDSRIMNEFSTAAYRLGHSLLSPQLLRLDAKGDAIAQGHLALRDAFFSPQRLAGEGGIEPILRGLAAQVCQNIDIFVIDDVRNFLFGLPGQGGFDLAALNIQRGRDHGLPRYNAARTAMGLAARTDFSQLSADPAVVGRMAAAYVRVDDIDLWAGGLAEDHVPGALVGELFHAILKRQFEALRDGDRFWYQNILNRDEQRNVEMSTLARIIRRNTDIDKELPDEVFQVSAHKGKRDK